MDDLSRKAKDFIRRTASSKATQAAAEVEAGVTLPAGVIQAFAGTTAPTGYLACDGSEVSRTTYASLFAAIGTTWGAGDGSTTFKLPDFETNNRFLRSGGGSLSVGVPYLTDTTATNGLSIVNPTSAASNHVHPASGAYAQMNVNAGWLVWRMGSPNFTPTHRISIGGGATTYGNAQLDSVVIGGTIGATSTASNTSSLTSSASETAPNAAVVKFIIKT